MTAVLRRGCLLVVIRRMAGYGMRRVISRANEATDLRRNAASRSDGFSGFGRLDL